MCYSRAILRMKALDNCYKLSLNSIIHMEIANVHSAKTHLSRLLEKVARGEEVIIAEAGRPVALLSPFRRKKTSRKPGVLKGKIRLAADFDALPVSFARHFTGKKLTMFLLDTQVLLWWLSGDARIMRKFQRV
jgi:prevent-host-death family protein